MGVERIDFHTIDPMAQDDVIPVIRERRFGAQVNDRAVSGGQDRVGRLAVRIAFQASDVKTFVHLPAFGAHAAEHAGGPRIAHCSDEKPFPSAGLKQSMVCCGWIEWLRASGGDGKGDQKGRQDTRDWIHD